MIPILDFKERNTGKLNHHFPPIKAFNRTGAPNCGSPATEMGTSETRLVPAETPVDISPVHTVRKSQLRPSISHSQKEGDKLQTKREAGGGEQARGVPAEPQTDSTADSQHLSPHVPKRQRGRQTLGTLPLGTVGNTQKPGPAGLGEGDLQGGCEGANNEKDARRTGAKEEQ